jgi:hypothetical protein
MVHMHYFAAIAGGSSPPSARLLLPRRRTRMARNGRRALVRGVRRHPPPYSWSSGTNVERRVPVGTRLKKPRCSRLVDSYY